MKILPEPIEFNWDRGNSGKNEHKHGITDKQAEESFFDSNKIIYKDIFHSVKEKRYILLGKTELKILLYIAFTMRSDKIRIISARRVNKKEAIFYEKTT